MVFFEVDKYANLYALREKVNSRTYIPLHNYSFIHRRSQTPREVFAAEPELKTIMSYALVRIAPIVESKLHPRTFNNRVGMGAQLAINTLIKDIYEVSEGYTKPCQIIKIDYKGYFPNMDRDYSYKLVSDIVRRDYHGHGKNDMLYCLAIACFTNPKRSKRKSPLWEWADYPQYKSVYSRPDGKGGFIGYTFWQMIASLYPAEIDKFIEKNISRHFVRYVDDTTIVTDNPEMVRAMIPELRRQLGKIGITMHPAKYYDQPCQHGVEFLGYYIRPGRVHIKRKTVARAMGVAKSKGRGKRNYFDAINSYLGMIKATSDLETAKALLDAVKIKGYKKDYENYKLVQI